MRGCCSGWEGGQCSIMKQKQKQKRKEMECVQTLYTNNSPFFACSLMSLLPFVEGVCVYFLDTDRIQSSFLDSFGRKMPFLYVDSLAHAYVHIKTSKPTHIRTHTHTFTHSHILTFTHSRIHTYTYTYAETGTETDIQL